MEAADVKNMVPAMALALDANFGSLERWRADFIGCARLPRDAEDWVLLSFLPQEGGLANQRSADPAHGGGGGVVLLALEAAAVRADADASIASIDWAPVYQRYQDAVHAASEPFGTAQDELAGAVLLDVRRTGVFEQAQTMLPGARWRDPAQVSQWGAELPAGTALVVYCVYGHEVGRSTAMRLRALGLQARYLRGGIDAWQAAGLPLAARATAAETPP